MRTSEELETAANEARMRSEMPGHTSYEASAGFAIASAIFAFVAQFAKMCEMLEQDRPKRGSQP